MATPCQILHLIRKSEGRQIRIELLGLCQQVRAEDGRPATKPLKQPHLLLCPDVIALAGTEGDLHGLAKMKAVADFGLTVTAFAHPADFTRGNE